MKKRYLPSPSTLGLDVAVVVLALLIAGCGGGLATSGDDSDRPAVNSPTVDDTTVDTTELDSLLDGLTSDIDSVLGDLAADATSVDLANG